MNVRRMAIVFDDSLRPETTGVYCRRALQKLVTIDHFRPDALEIMPRQGYDLYLHIDDGLSYPLPSEVHPRAFWAIDTHVDLASAIKKSQGCDFVFTAQRNGAEQLRENGIDSAMWLPLACDEEIHRPHGVSKKHDVCFVGNVIPGPRRELLDLIQREFSSSFVGQRYFEEMARAYSASRIVFNRSVADDVNMRVFEALACGSLLVTNDLGENGQAELFRDSVHLVTYRDAQEMLDRLRFWLAREDLRTRVEQNGRELVLARHTYRHRMLELLQRVNSQPTAIAVAAGRTAKTNGNPGVLVRLANERARKQETAYFECARPEILALIPLSAGSLLDVGCGAGRLGATLKSRQPVRVTGLELDETAAAAARQVLDEVLVGDVEKSTKEFQAANFDCVVCGDVLEHFSEPCRFLRRARQWLAPDGCLVASFPNTRHHSIVRGLLNGNFTYEPAGLLDHTHVRLFTRRSIEELFTMAGFQIVQVQIVPGAGYAEWEQQGRPGSVRLGQINVTGLPSQEAEEFFVYQYLIVARPLRSPPPDTRAVPAVHSDAIESARHPMQFRQDFLWDFEQVDFWGEPFALVRFADGERAICVGDAINGTDGWTYSGGQSQWRDELHAALSYDDPAYFVGISDGCCDRVARDYYLQHVRVPQVRLTFSNLFVNWNYRRFRQLDLSGMCIVAGRGGDLAVPENIFAPEAASFSVEGLVEKLIAIHRPILVSAGPAAKVIIHKYWQRAGSKRQVIVDVGSALDEFTKGTVSRRYQIPGSRTADLICQW